MIYKNKNINIGELENILDDEIQSNVNKLLFRDFLIIISVFVITIILIEFK